MDSYVVLDLEMTGLNPKTDKILEIGAAKVEQNVVVSTMSVFVNPHQTIAPKITELTGITDEMVQDGIEAAEAVKQLIAFCENQVVVGHNVIYDYSFVKQCAINERLSFETMAVDTLKIARKMMPELEHKSLEYLCEYFHIVREREHRALDDALATKELFDLLKERFEGEDAKIFEPYQLQYRAKRQTPATKIQKIHLKELMDYHKISLDICFDDLTRSEASRLTDQILSQYGKVIKA